MRKQILGIEFSEEPCLKVGYTPNLPILENCDWRVLRKKGDSKEGQVSEPESAPLRQIIH